MGSTVQDMRWRIDSKLLIVRCLNRTMILALACAMLATTAFAAEYYVAAKGDDAHAGTQASPWRTLAKVCAIAEPGDTAWLGAGTYRETLRPHVPGTKGKIIRFVAMSGEKVVLSGAEPLVGAWQQYTGSIYKLQTSLKFIQLFADGKMQQFKCEPSVGR